MTLETLLASIPYVVWHKLTVDVDCGNEVTLCAPFRPELANYVGTFHAGVLFTLAETAAGVVADRAIPDNRAFVLLRSARVRYTRRPEGDVRATAHTTPAGTTTARADFEANARADISAQVSMTDATGTTVFDGEFDHALRPRKP